MRIRYADSYFSIGVLCQSFSGPSDEICPGDNVTFTCVVSSITTRWTVSPGGDDDRCIYTSDDPDPETCGPDDRFQSSRTDDSVPANNSSLSVLSITSDLNGTTVTCTEGGSLEIVGTYNICIVGKHAGCQFLFVKVLKFQQKRYQLLSSYQPLSLKEVWVWMSVW